MSENVGKPKRVYIWNLIDGSPRTPDELATYRLNICKQCPWFRENSQTCKKCGCFMTLKTQLAKAYCPMGFWDQIDTSQMPE